MPAWLVRGLRAKWMRTLTGAIAVFAVLAGVVVLGADRAHQAPTVRLHGGAAWLPSNEVGELTLVDGSSAEVAARVKVATPGNFLQTWQVGSSGYALDHLGDGSVVRIDGATLEPTRSATPVAPNGIHVYVFPGAQTFYALDSFEHLLTPFDPATLEPSGTRYQVSNSILPDKSAVDDDGRLWTFDDLSGELVWFSEGVRHTRAGAGTPNKTQLRLTAGQPVLLDSDRRTAELLDPDTGAVLQSVEADVNPNDSLVVSGAPHEPKLLILNPFRGVLTACTFRTRSCTAPLPVGAGGALLGTAIEAGNHAIVPDYSTGSVRIIDLGAMRVVAERQLFDGPKEFDLLTRDGVVFYNDPSGDQAGVLEIDGRVRPVSKYAPVKPDKDPSQVADGGETSSAGAVSGPPGSGLDAKRVSIAIKPGDRGLVGEEFELTAVAQGTVGVVAARWTFGDGGGASGVAVRHRWDRPGRYPVTVTPTLTTGQPAPVATATVAIEPGDAPPRIVRLDVSPTTPRVGQPVTFAAVLAGGRAERWQWTVHGERGEEATSTLPEFQHIFTAPGSYTATFTAMAGNVRVQESRQISVAAEAPEVHCGAILTVSATLKRDLTCPDEVAVTIAANDVVLDLGGHVLTTNNPTDTSVGVRIAQPQTLTNTVVQNGSITRFKTGISMARVMGVRVMDVTISSSSVPVFRSPDKGADIAGEHAQEVLLSKVVLAGTIKFLFNRESQVEITDSSIVVEGDTGESAARCVGGSSCTVQNSKLRLSHFVCTIYYLEPTVKSSITIDSSDIDIRQTGNYSCDSLTISNSSRMRPGRAWSGGRVIFVNNPVEGVAPSDWQEIDADSFNVTGNTFAEMDVGLQVWRGSGKIAGNTFLGNGGVGLRVNPDLYDTTISGNKFVSNGHVNQELRDHERGGLIMMGDPYGSRGITVTGNHAQGNSGYGIWTIRDRVFDGGGNTSSGDQFPCEGVACQ